MTRKLQRLAAALAALGLSVVHTVAAEDDPRNHAIALLDAGKAGEACDLLTHHFGASPAADDVVLMLAHCSWQSGRAEAAIGHYRTLIARHPQATRPRVELATLYLQLDRRDEARAEFAAIRQIDPRLSDRAILGGLARALAADDPSLLAAATPKNWQVQVFTGIVHDSNINSGPTATTVAAVIGGVPVDLTLSPDSRPIASLGSSTTVNGRYLHGLNRNFAVMAQGSLARTFYFDDSSFNNDSAAGALALLYRDGGFTASLQPNFRFTRQDNDLVETTYGVTGQAAQVVTDKVRLSGALGYFYRNTHANKARDADAWLASLCVTVDAAKGLQLGGQYSVQDEKAAADFQSRTLHGPLLYGNWLATPKLNLSFSYRYSRVSYDEPQAIFPEARRDRQHVLGLNGLWDVSDYVMRGTAVRLSWSYIDTQSNIALFDNHRHILTGGFRLTF